MARSKPLFLATGVALVAVALTGAARAEDDARGRELFQLCAQCHGAQGSGNRLFLAPAIAGLSQWYVEEQLRKFHSGLRGTHPEDTGGLRMYPMSLAIKDDADIERLAAYVASLAPVYPEPELDGGDAKRGEVLYTPCKACHAADGSGVEVLGGPNMKVTNDWYLLTQLHNFKNGLRGANPKDARGVQMRAMSMTLADEQAMKDVVAYIMTLAEQR